jgi:D-alanyl-D-alanine carboxypeptidase/D-alanyl-D-alanine-endopeptidase (penicillin-binding protein 4)
LYNYVTPDLMIRLLRYAYLKRDVMAALYPALPVAGVDGTLKKRMTKGFAFENVHAKTGTVSGISSLAGYCRAANHHLLAFCIINQGVMKTADGRAFQDQVCEVLCSSR